MAVLECKTLSKRYGEIAALDEIDLSLEAGQISAFSARMAQGRRR